MTTILEVIKAIGAIATAVSVIWAIYIFKRSETQKAFSKTRESLATLKSNISSLDDMLGEPEFTMVSYNITKSLKELKPNSWSLNDFTEFLSKKESAIYVANAIHMGRNNCALIENIEKLLNSIESLPISIKSELPIVSLCINNLLFYIKKPGRNALSPAVFAAYLTNSENIEKVLKPNLDKIQFEELYFGHLTQYIEAGPISVMNRDKLGERTFKLTEKAISIIVDTFNKMTDRELKVAKNLQHKVFLKTREINNEHSIEDAISMLQLIRSSFSETDWDTIIDIKGRIVELMTDSED